MVIAALNNWLKRKNMRLRNFDEREIDQFVRWRNLKIRGFARRGERVAIGILIGYLRKLGAVLTPPKKFDATRNGIIVGKFCSHLRRNQALSSATEINYSGYARLFLSEYGPSRSMRKLSATDVTSFVRRHARDQSSGRASLMVTALRSFFRFLRLRGDISKDLAACIPAVARWRLANLPKFIEPSEVKLLLKHCDRKTNKGQRDYAILLLISRLGLRAGEVVALELEDVNWQSGEISIQGKGKRRARFPLPKDVGAAIADYLRHARPVCASRRLFLRTRAPLRGFATSANIGTIVSRTLTKAGLNPPCRGAHLLRHSAAVQILRNGSSLAEVGEVLRHKSINTTAIYAKVDLRRLSELARPWPRVAGGDV